MRVSTLYLTDHFTGEITVTINGKKYTYTRTGSGYAKKIAIEWNSTITRKGIEIKLNGRPNRIDIPQPIKPDKEARPLVLPNKMSPYDVMEAINADKSTALRRVLMLRVATTSITFNFPMSTSVKRGQPAYV